MSDDIGSLFADLTLMIEYCSVYDEGGNPANESIDYYYEEGGELVISESSRLALNKAVNNRQRLWNYLIDEASRCLRTDNPEENYKANVLNFTSLQTTLGFDLEEGYLPDIMRLKELVDEQGLEDFRSLLNDIKLLGDRQREELETVIEPVTFDRGGRGGWMLESSISKYTMTDNRTESLMDYVYWMVDWGDAPIIVGDDGEIASNTDELEALIQRETQTTPDFFTASQFADKIDTS